MIEPKIGRATLVDGDERTRQGNQPRIVVLAVMPPKPCGSTPKPPEELSNDASAEFNAHSFIIKVWTEGDANEERGLTWRGYITHVPSGEQRHLRQLGEIETFVEPYLKAMGIEIGLRKRITKWLGITNA